MTNQQRAEARKMFFDQFNNCVEYRNEELYPGETFWMDKDSGKWVFNYHLNCPSDFWIRYEFWIEFETKFNLNYDQTRDLLKPLVEEAFKKEGLTPSGQEDSVRVKVEEAFKKEGLTPKNKLLMLTRQVEEAFKKETAMQNKKTPKNYEITIPENHTAKVETIGSKVVVTFEPVQMNFTRDEVIKLFEHALDMPDVLTDAVGHNVGDFTPREIFEMAEKYLQSRK